MRSGERREVVRLLSSLTSFQITERVGWKAAEFSRSFRRSHSGIGRGDYLIAATTQVNGLELATLNVRRYPMFSGLAAPFDVVSSG
jgi:predicted nucleic acid-binding protein